MKKKIKPYAKLSFLSTCLFSASLLGIVSTSHSEELSAPPDGPSPPVEAVESLPQVEPSFSPGEEEQASEPKAPAILLEDIPPMPMPYPPDNNQSSPANEGPGAPESHDLVTGETTTGVEAEAANLKSFGQGGYYPGSDGGPGDGELTIASFGTKSKVNNVDDFPWRMNVKVAMRFGASWFVCSGAMRDIRTVQTAGHCIHQGNGGSWADEVLVFPGWDGNGNIIPFNPDVETYGGARGISLTSWTGWTQNGNFDFDWGAIALDRAVGSLTGWYGWQTGNNCPTATYNVGPYPAENCPSNGLHNGRDMYYWWGTIDSCPGNQLQVNTSPGCLTALWGGESGSNIYELSGTSRFTRGIASTSNRTTIGNYVETKSSWVTHLNNTFIPNTARGATFDLQPLDVNATPTTIRAGNSTTSLNHLGANGTNGTKNSSFSFDVRLSTNDNISTADTLLSNHIYNFNYPAVGSARVNSANVTIPKNTPPGDYWLGVLYTDSTDSNTGNNDSDDWDAQKITVLPPFCTGESITISAPGSTTSDTTPTYQWTASPCATHYYLWIVDNGFNTQYAQYVTKEQAGCSNGTGTCSYTPATTLDPTGAYMAMVPYNQGTNSFGNWTPWHSFDVCSAPAASPSLISPTGVIGTTNPTYTWNASPGTAWYNLYVTDTLGNPQVYAWYQAAVAGCASGAGTCSVTTGVPQSGDRLWYIAPANQCGGVSPYSSGLWYRAP